MYCYENLDAGIAAVDRHRDAGDIGRCRRGEEQDSGIEFAFIAIALERDHAVRIVLEELGIKGFLGQRSVEIARADGIDGNAVFTPFRSKPRVRLTTPPLAAWYGEAGAILLPTRPYIEAMLITRP